LIPYGISSRTATVSLIHDLAPFRVENIYPPARQRYHQWLMKSVAARADHLVAISEATKLDIQEFLRVPAERITVIPNATDREIYRGEPDEIGRHRRRLALPDRYILFVGKVQPRKNLVRLIQAFGMVPPSGERSDLHLVIAGGKGWLDEAIRKAHDHSRVKDRIRFAGHVSDEDLSWYYRCAELFCFPSLYEGFGLPILEAMANGVPVAASGIGAMAEVVGDAGRTFDPYSPEDMARVLAEMLDDKPGRAEFSERGYHRVSRFSWENSAAEYASLWRKLR
jgi:glycosyltransferase involved in cell wall biosynthesis